MSPALVCPVHVSVIKGRNEYGFNGSWGDFLLSRWHTVLKSSKSEKWYQLGHECHVLYYASAGLCCNGGIKAIFFIARRGFCPSRVLSQIYIVRFGTMLNGFRWNSKEVITTTKNNDYILGKTRTGTRKQDRTEYSNRRQSVLLRCQTRADAQRMNSQISLHRLWQIRSRRFSR